MKRDRKPMHVWVKPWEQKDIPQATEWFMGLADKNLYDPSVLMYPATQVLKAHTNEKTLVFCPVQDCFVMDALGIAPDATPLETSSALKSLVLAIRYQSEKEGKREIYFGCKDQQTADFAMRQGFEELPFKFYRMKL